MDIKEELREIAILMLSINIDLDNFIAKCPMIEEDRALVVHAHDLVERVKKRMRYVYEAAGMPEMQDKERPEENWKGNPIGGRDH